jgi:4-hydroxybutyrate dehydrogenase / sulfolactaldehyde 3-reductase
MERIGFAGLGRMGKGMASNLQKKGFDLTVFDLQETPLAALEKLGAKRAASFGELIRNCDIVLTALPGPQEVEAAINDRDGIAVHGRPGMIFMDHSTVDPTTTDRLSDVIEAKGMSWVDAPIGRLASHAERGECLFMVGASAADFARVKPLLQAMGTTIHHCGPVGHGIRTKLVNNYLSVVSCQMNAEVLTLANSFGLDLETTLDVIHGTSATNGQLKLNFATKVLVGDTEPGFSVDLAHKDLTLIVNSANTNRVALPIAAVARESLSLARSTPYHGKDFSALLDFWCERAGLAKMRFRTQGPAQEASS